MVKKTKKTKKKTVAKPVKKTGVQKKQHQKTAPKAAAKKIKKAAPARHKVSAAPRMIIGPQKTVGVKLPAVPEVHLPVVVGRKSCGCLHRVPSGALFVIYALAVGLLLGIAMPPLLMKIVQGVGVVAVLWQIAKTARVYWRRQVILTVVSAALMYQLFATLQVAFPDTAYLSWMLLPMVLFFAWHNPQTNKGIVGLLAAVPILVFLAFISGIVSLVHAGLGALIGPVFMVAALFLPVLLIIHWIWLKLLISVKWFVTALILEIGSLVILSQSTVSLISKLKEMPAPELGMAQVYMPQIIIATGVFITTLVLSVVIAYVYHFVRFVRRRRAG